MGGRHEDGPFHPVGHPLNLPWICIPRPRRSSHRKKRESAPCGTRVRCPASQVRALYPARSCGLWAIIERMDAAYYDDLRGGLSGLLVGIDDRLSGENKRWLTGFLDAGEYGLAHMAEARDEDTPVANDEREDIIRLAGQMNLGERSLAP